MTNFQNGSNFLSHAQNLVTSRPGQLQLPTHFDAFLKGDVCLVRHLTNSSKMSQEE